MNDSLVGEFVGTPLMRVVCVLHVGEKVGLPAGLSHLAPAGATVCLLAEAR